MWACYLPASAERNRGIIMSIRLFVGLSMLLSVLAGPAVAAPRTLYKEGGYREMRGRIWPGIRGPQRWSPVGGGACRIY